MVRQRVSRRKPRRGGRRVGRRVARRNNRKFNLHAFKRRAATIIVGLDQNNIPTLVQDGNGAMKLGSISSGPYLSNTSQFGMSYNAQLAQAVEYTDFTALFDRYKITGVKLRILYQNNMGDPNSHALPAITTAWDGDDAGVPSNKEDVTRKLFSRTKVLNANKPMSVYFRPRITKAVYQAGLTTAYTSERTCYLDCNNATIEHYGYKFWVESWLATTGAQSGQIMIIEPTLYFSCKDSQ